MIPLLTAIASAFVEIIIGINKAGDDKAKQEEALMVAAERIAELRERVKFPDA